MVNHALLPADIACAADQDGNGLDDIVERELANCFAPAYRYDREELLEPDATGHLRACTESRNDDAPSLCKRAKDYPIPTGFTQPAMAEPNVLFAMTRVGLEADKQRPLVHVTYRALWEWDGGFTVASGFFECGNEHHGDSQSLSGTIALDTDGYRWWGELSVFDIAESDAKPNAGGPTERLGGHPVIYISAGKHHEYHAAGTGDYDLSGGTSCTDSHQGDGPVVIPGATPGTLLTHLPAIPIPAKYGEQPGFFSNAQNSWLNACFAGNGVNGVLATGFQSNNLSNMGYSQKLSDENFFSDVAGSAGVNVAQASPDGDGDGQNDAYSFTYTLNVNGHPIITSGVVKPSGSDRCPLQAGTPNDADSDLLVGKCDPSEDYRHQYVHVGNASLPTCTASLAIQNYATCRLGYLDRDQDATVNGDDDCPNTKSHFDGSDPNRWAELANFPKGSASEVRNNGQFHRGRACDPYAHGSVKWATSVDDAQSGYSVPSCTFGTFKAHIDGSGDYSTQVLWAKSEIEPDNVGANFVQSQTYRCRCDQDGTACLQSDASQCNSRNVQRAVGNAGVPDVQGWRPVWREGCAKDATGHCAAVTSVEYAKKGGGAFQKRDERWDFVGESTQGPPGSFAPSELVEHAQEGDCPTPLLNGTCVTAHTETKRPYALWSEQLVAPLTLNASWATTLPAGPGPFFPEPETTAPGQILLDILDKPSRRQRSGFAEGRTMITPYDVSRFKPCATIDFTPAKLWEALWKVDPGPDDPYPWDKLTLPISIVAAGSDAWSSLVLIPALSASYRIPVLESQGSWVLASSGLAALVMKAGRTGPEAGLLWVERGARVRWALLAPSSRTDTEQRFTIGTEDVLDFPVSPSAKLLSDAFGKRVVVLDSESKEWMAHLDVTSGTWRTVRFSADQIPTGAAVYLEGARLYVHGGTDGRGTIASGFIYDLDNELAVPWAPGFPARRDARLVRSNDSEALLLLGGHDGLRNHDDLWSVYKRPGARARLVRPDTGLASTFDARTTAVSADADGEGARILRLTGDIFENRRRTLRGWESSDAPAVGESCGSTDVRAGERCPTPGAAFWAPGVRECASRGGACVASPSVSELRTELPAAAIDFAVDETAVWTVSGNRVRRYQVSPDLAAVQTVDFGLPSGPHEIAAAGSVALVTGNDGVRALSTATTTLPSATRICGRPLHVASLGGGRFAVTTTLGFNVVKVENSVAAVESVRLLFGDGNQAGQAEPMPVTPVKLAWCQLADAAMPAALVDVLRKRSMVAAGSPGRVVAGLSPWLFAIDASQPGSPVIRGSQIVSGRDAVGRWEGDRLYLVSDQRQPLLRWTAAADALTSAGTHDVASWVSAQGEAPVVARLLPTGKVEVAWIAR